MGWLIGELQRQQATARAEADQLRSRIGELEQDLARAEEQVSRLVIAREGVMRVLADPAGTELPGPGRPWPRTRRATRPGSRRSSKTRC